MAGEEGLGARAKTIDATRVTVQFAEPLHKLSENIFSQSSNDIASVVCVYECDIDFLRARINAEIL